MGRQRNTALKGIVAIGVIAFLFLWVASFGLKKALKPNDAERVAVKRSESSFDPDHAMLVLQTLTSTGSRAPSAPGNAAARACIKSSVPRAREIEVKDTEPSGGQTFHHVVAEISGRKPGRLLVMTHYSSFGGAGPAYLGANDGAASSACLVEVARGFSRDSFGRSVVFAWLDGPADSAEEIGASASVFLDALQAEPNAAKIDAAIYLEGVGDCYLHLAADAAAPAWLSTAVDDVANQLGFAKHFGAMSGAPSAVSLAMNARGIPTIALVDPSYGGSLVEHAKYWHTEADTLEHVCPESLKAIGDVLYHALPAIDGSLDAMGIATP